MRAGLLHCDAFDDEFSEAMTAELIRASESALRAVPEMESQPATHWHCPRCAARMHRTPGEVLGSQCAACGYTLLPPVAYHLAELRTHPYSEEERAHLERVLPKLFRQERRSSEP
jgi:hypothetical protein